MIQAPTMVCSRKEQSMGTALLVAFLAASILVSTVSISVDLVLYLISRKTVNKHLLLVLTSMEVVLIAVLAIALLSAMRRVSPGPYLAAMVALFAGGSGVIVTVPIFYHYVLELRLGRRRVIFGGLALAFFVASVLLLLLNKPDKVLFLLTCAVPNSVCAYCVVLSFVHIRNVRDVFFRYNFLLANIVETLYLPISFVELLLTRTCFATAVYALIFNGLFIIPTLFRMKKIRWHDEDAAAVSFTARFGITEREKEVVLLLRSGLSSGDIASRLFISHKTLETHVTNIYRKTGARNRVQLLNILSDGG